MRSDLIAYFIGIICFIVGLYIPLQFGYDLINTALLIVFFLFGFFFIMFGYSLRPRKLPLVTPPKVTEAQPTAPEPEKIEETKAEETFPPEAKPTTELTQVKGIGPKRAAQLKAIGISTVQDLAKASATEIAAKLKVPEKIVEKWIQEAKNVEKT
jgi:predicted flap endonuclease-1-like 5' DNA nuclease